MTGDGRCSWCDQPEAGRLILKPGRGAKLPQTAPACTAHIRHFNSKGVITTEQKRRGDDART